MYRAFRAARPSCLNVETQNVSSYGFRSFFAPAMQKSRSLHMRCNLRTNLIDRQRRTILIRARWISTDRSSADEHAPRRSRILSSVKILSLVATLSVLGGLQYFFVFRHLEKVPQTGRWRRMNISPEMEAQLGEEAYLSILSQYRDAILPGYHPITQHVREVINSILDANGLGTIVRALEPDLNSGGSEQQWRLALIADDSVPNSTASHGGIVVFTGLLSVCQNDDELAAILGHEIAHVVARHLAERYSKAKDWSLKQLLVGPFVSTPKNQRRAEGELKQLMSSNLHEQELEADAIGLELSSRACFDPRAAINVNRRLATFEERFRRVHPEFKPTHPCSEERIKHLERLLPKAYESMSKSPKCAGTQIRPTA